MRNVVQRDMYRQDASRKLTCGESTGVDAITVHGCKFYAMFMTPGLTRRAASPG